MSERRQAVERTGRGDHLLQFYRTEETLADTVGHFLSAGLRQGETAVAISTPTHRAAFERALAAQGVDLAASRVAGRLVELDAEATLALFMSEGQPVWSRFEAAMRPVLDRARAASASRHVRAYGEMVDLLWQAGNLSGALSLEKLWNKLLDGREIPLFCAYKADLLDERHGGVLQHALQAHSHLISSHDELEQAVGEALETVLGAAKARALRPLIAANQPRGAKLPWPEAAVFWVKHNLPGQAQDILSRARERLQQLAPAA